MGTAAQIEAKPLKLQRFGALIRALVEFAALFNCDNIDAVGFIVC